MTLGELFSKKGIASIDVVEAILILNLALIFMALVLLAE